ncbi:MAG: glycosyltransferase family 2 protein [Bacteriovoracaceae bacterium]
MKVICIVAGCYNEKGNIQQLYNRIKKLFETLPGYDFRLQLIDNKSTDGTRQELEQICASDPRVRAIFNSRNFGHVRSPYYNFLQAEGDLIFTTVSDLQVDPEIIAEFIKKHEAGADIVIGIKTGGKETFFFRQFRNLYYSLVSRLSEVPQRKNFIGITLLTKKAADAIKAMHDPYPYFRGMVFEVGFNVAEVTYVQRSRVRGFTKNSFLTLYDVAMLGIASHSKIPLRLMTMTGFFTAFCSLCMAVLYLALKFLYWKSFRMGIAPLVIGLFFLGSIQLIFLGIIGEYIGFIFTKLENRPLVVEEKRINF